MECGGKFLNYVREDRMKISTIIATRNENYNFFKLAYDSARKAGCNKGENKIYVFDFTSKYSSHGDKISKIVESQDLFLKRPGEGFCSNYSFGMALANLGGYEYICCLNDDLIIPPNFLHNAVEFLEEQKGAGFVGGVQQWCKEVQISPERLIEMPMPAGYKVAAEFTDLRGVWGDFSAFVIRREAMRDTGHLDSNFDPTGILADNDWLLRMRKAGWETWRCNNMRYLHGKGITQREFRPNFPYDDVGIKNRAYFIQKWGCDPYGDQDCKTYDKPFDGIYLGEEIKTEFTSGWSTENS